MIVQTRHESAYLADNMLGDSGERDLFVYLPPDYEESDRHYTTAYLLHAFGEGAKDVVNPRRTASGGGHRSRTSSTPSSAAWECRR